MRGFYSDQYALDAFGHNPTVRIVSARGCQRPAFGAPPKRLSRIRPRVSIICPNPKGRRPQAGRGALDARPGIARQFRSAVGHPEPIFSCGGGGLNGEAGQRSAGDHKGLEPSPP